MSKRTKLNSTSGMTLVEVIISILLAGIAFGSIAIAFTTGLSGIRAMREYSFALQKSQERMETLRNSVFNYLIVGDNVFSIVDFPAQGITTDGVYKIESITTDLKKVSTRVTWVSTTGRTMQVNLVTYMARDGING